MGAAATFARPSVSVHYTANHIIIEAADELLWIECKTGKTCRTNTSWLPHSWYLKTIYLGRARNAASCERSKRKLEQDMSSSDREIAAMIIEQTLSGVIEHIIAPLVEAFLVGCGNLDEHSAGMIVQGATCAIQELAVPRMTWWLVHTIYARPDMYAHYSALYASAPSYAHAQTYAHAHSYSHAAYA